MFIRGASTHINVALTGTLDVLLWQCYCKVINRLTFIHDFSVYGVKSKMLFLSNGGLNLKGTALAPAASLDMLFRFHRELPLISSNFLMQQAAVFIKNALINPLYPTCPAPNSKHTNLQLVFVAGEHAGTFSCLTDRYFPQEMVDGKKQDQKHGSRWIPLFLRVC